MKHEDIIAWEKLYRQPLFIGARVRVKPSCEYYEPENDQFTSYTVVMLYVDRGGLNIGLNDGRDDSYMCESDGYYIADLEPASN